MIADSRIEIVPVPGRLRIELGGVILAESDDALALHERGHRVRYYLPREDVSAALLPSDSHTRCPFKGEASYHHVEVAGARHSDLVWFYPDPIEAVDAIRDRVSFYDERVDVLIDGELRS